MAILYLVYLSVSLFPTAIIAQLPEYHQNDYDVKFERAEVIWFNKSYVKDVNISFPFYNRTQRVANASGYLLIDQRTTDVVGEIQVYKFLSNEYRYFPISVAANLCIEYKHNNFNVQGLLKNNSNVRGCPIKKGFYYAYNIIPDFSRLPPFIPRGRYKGVAKLYYAQQFVAEGHGYVEIVDKPMKWYK